MAFVAKSGELMSSVMTDIGTGIGVVPRTELDQLHHTAGKVADESLESTRRMLSLCEEGQDSGAKTLVMLGTQGEQLDRVEEGMDQINSDMKEAEKHLTGMEACCGLFSLPCFTKLKEFKEDASTWADKGDGVMGDQPQRVMDERNGVPAGAMQIGRITSDAREDEMEENLCQVNTMIDNLRNMATDMGSEIENQNRQIDRIDAKVVSNDDRIKLATDRAGLLVKKA